MNRFLILLTLTAFVVITSKGLEGKGTWKPDSPPPTSTPTPTVEEKGKAKDDHEGKAGRKANRG